MSRNISLTFDHYQLARVAFVQSVAESASRQQNVKYLENGGVLELLKPLITDPLHAVRHGAAVALGKIAEHNVNCAKQMIDLGILDIVKENLDQYNVSYKRSMINLVKAISKHNSELATQVVQYGLLEDVVSSLQHSDMQVRENSAWAIGYIGRHSLELTDIVAKSEAIQPLVQGLREPEMCLRQICAGALSDLANHRPEAVAKEGAIEYLIHALDCMDGKLKRCALRALAALAMKSMDLANEIASAGGIPLALLHFGHESEIVRRNAVILVRDIAKHSPDLCQLIVNGGGCGALVNLLNDKASLSRIPTAMAIGYIAGQSDQLAMAVIGSKAVTAIARLLDESINDEELGALVWTIGHIAKHSPQHTQAVSDANIQAMLLKLYIDGTNSEELRSRCYCALKNSLQCCLTRQTLEPLLHLAPPEILKYVLAQYSKILPNDPRARRMFVTTGGLRRLQELKFGPDSELTEFITVINSCFPEEILCHCMDGLTGMASDCECDVG